MAHNAGWVDAFANQNDWQKRKRSMTPPLSEKSPLLAPAASKRARELEDPSPPPRESVTLWELRVLLVPCAFFCS